jgi:ribosome-associated protein
MTNKEYALLAAKVLSDKKAEDLVIIDILGKATFADYFVICSGNSERQIAALTDEVEDKLAEAGLTVKSIEGRQGSGWILMDFGDIIVNIFTNEMRERYSIEKVWGDCQFIEVEE